MTHVWLIYDPSLTQRRVQAHTYNSLIQLQPLLTYFTCQWPVKGKELVRRGDEQIGGREKKGRVMRWVERRRANMISITLHQWTRIRVWTMRQGWTNASDPERVHKTQTRSDNLSIHQWVCRREHEWTVPFLFICVC